jgi:hypothetical protein
MDDIRRVLRLAAWRLFVADLVRTLAVTTAAVLAALILTRLVERIFGLELPWTPIGWGAGAAAVLSALGWSTARRARGVAVARQLDERADLRETLSTALCVERSTDAWAAVIIESARDKARTVQVKKAIPITAPRLWPVPLSLGIALAAVCIVVPPMDVMGLLASRKQVQQDQQQLQEVKSEIQTQDKKLQELLDKAKVDLKDKEKADAGDEPEAKTPEELRRVAIKKLTSINDKLNQLKDSEKAAQMQAVKDAMRQLKQPGPGPMEELSRAMARGDFAKAQQELNEMSKKLQDGSMSPEQKQQAQAQLQKLAQQLDKLGKDKTEMEKKLQQAGMSKEAAKEAMKNPEAMKKAMEALKNMTEEQKKELMKMASAQSKAGQQCEKMGEAMDKMAKGMGKQGMNEEGLEGMKGMGGQLDDMEMMSKDLDGLEAAMGECAGQLAQLGECMGNCKNGGTSDPNKASPWKAGDTNKLGQGGTGGPGRNMGGNGRDGKEQAFTTEKVQAGVKTGKGPIIGSRIVYGEQSKGSSVAEFADAVEAASKSAAEAIETQQVPREYQNVVKTYFGHLKDKTGEKAAEPAQPATEAKDAGKK